MRTIDFAIPLVYLTAVVAIGVLTAPKSRTASQLFLGGRELSWFPLGISVMVSAFSAVNFIAFPSEIVKHGPAVLIALPVFLLVLPPLLRWVIPFFRKQEGVSAYGFLADKYGPEVKHLATGIFTLWRLLWIAVTLYASAKMVSIFSGFPLISLLLVTGGIALLYATIGGLRAVVFTDLLQFCVLFGSVALAIFFAVRQDILTFSAVGQWFSDHPLPNNFFSPVPTIRISFWSGLIGTFIAFFARYGADQITIQRYMAAQSEQAAKQAIVANALAALVVLSLLLFLGITLSIMGSKTGVPPIKQMALLAGSMPPGVTGLFVAALLAATMSSVDSGLNSMAAALAEEMPLLKHAKQGKIVTFTLGLVALMAALLLIPIMGREQSLFVLTNKIVHGFGAPLLSLILLAMFSQQVTKTGIFWGTITGVLSSVLTVLFLKNLAIHYYAVVNFAVAIGFSYLFSLWPHKRDK